MADIVHEKSITGSDYCGGCGQDWPCQHERLRQEVEHWKGMYEQSHQQRSNWYERCQAAERQLAEVIGQHVELRERRQEAIVGVDPPVPGAYRIVAACHCGRPLLFPGDTDPWCQGCNMSATTCDCVATVAQEG